MRIPLSSGASFASFTVCPAFAAPSSILPSQPGTVMPPPAMLRPVSSDAAAAGACAWPTPTIGLLKTTTQIIRQARRMVVLSRIGICVQIISAIAEFWPARKSVSKQTLPPRVPIRYTLVTPTNLVRTESTFGTIYRSTRTHHIYRPRLRALHQPQGDSLAHRSLGPRPPDCLRVPGHQVELRPDHPARCQASQ